MLFKAPKKQENTKVAEEIKITNVRNFYNDSLENDPEYNEEEEEEVEEKKEEPENIENKENKVNVEEVIEGTGGGWQDTIGGIYKGFKGF